MKTCPACASRFSDDTLQFCLQDGTRLYSADEAGAPTAVLNEIETAESRKPLPPTNWQAPVTQRNPQASGGRKIAIAVVLTVLGTILLVLGGAAVGVWLYSRSAQTEVFTDPSPGPSPNIRATATPRTPTPTVSPSPSATVETKPPINEAEIREDVLDRLEDWSSDSEAGDIDAYMSNYAATIDYYQRGPSNAAFVRRDKLRAFERYSSIEVSLSNISVSPAADGETATAIFDKEWNFSGNGNSSGKVQQMLRLRKVGGQWLITAEKDLKLYYKR